MKQEPGRGPGLQKNVQVSIKKLEHSPETNIEIPLSGLDPQSEGGDGSGSLLAYGHRETYTGHIQHHPKVVGRC